MEAVLDDARWAPSGGNEQPWNVSLLVPEQSARLRARFEQRGWNALTPKLWSIAERMAGARLSATDAAGKIAALVERDGLIRGSAFALLVHYEPEQPGLETAWRAVTTGRLHGAKALVDSLRMMFVVSPQVRHDSVICFLHAICVAATERGLATCVQHTYLNHQRELGQAYGIPSGHRLAGVIWVGRELAGSERAGVGRSRRPVPTRIFG